MLSGDQVDLWSIITDIVNGAVIHETSDCEIPILSIEKRNDVYHLTLNKKWWCGSVFRDRVKVLLHEADHIREKAKRSKDEH